jgi:murein DD-endopeptidase MepM/ murein hydrolase activator NlpD
MARRIVLGLAVALLAAAPAGADDIVQKKQSVDAQIAALNTKVGRMRQSEAALEAQITAASSRIRSLERQVGDVSRQLGPLESELRLRQLRLNRLNALYKAQTERLRFLRREYKIALERLNARLVAIYESDEPDTFAVLLSAESFSDVLDAVDYLRRIGTQDKRIADTVRRTKQEARHARARTKVARDRVRQEARVVAVRVAQVRGLRNQLLAGKQQLAGERAQKRQSLATLTEQERQELGEMEALQQVSAQLAARIQAAQAARTQSPAAHPSASGLIWPVNGPVTSPFGPRWGRMHTGIDIGASTGMPIHASASGTVIIAGWVGGYGNLVFVDHGNGLSTGYAHQSQIAVSAGQEVTQGQVIGYVGCTGHCFGPHLHFEVRVNGVPVDPLGYL